MIHYTGFIPLAALVLLLTSILGFVLRKGRPLTVLKLAFALLIAGWFLYAFAFVSLDYTLYEVFWNTSPGLPVWMRFASSWAGGGGSLFLFSFVVAISSLAMLRGYDGKRWLPIGLATTALISLVAAFLSKAFLQIEEAVGGAGLNPLLKSVWLYPHPLTTFGGYALLVVGSLGLLAGLRKRGYMVFEVGWTFLTLGIMIGGYWSYETFGWGGYWAWDPVETAELMVWLAATLYPHLNVVSRNLRNFVLYFIPSTVFLAMYVTRTGLSPLHSFASPNIGMMLLLVASLGFLAFAFYSLSKAELSKRSLSLPLKDPYRFGMYLTTVAFILSFFFVFGSLFVPALMASAGVDVSVPQMSSGIKYFHPVLYPIMVIFLVGVPMVFLGRRLGWRGYFALMGTTLILGGIFAVAALQGTLLLAPLTPFETNALMAFGLPLASVALFSTLADLVLRARKGLRALSDRMSGIGLLHMGMALTVIGILLSGTFAFNESYFLDLSLKPGEPVTIPGGAKLLLKDFSYEIGEGTIDIYSRYVKRLDSYFLAWEGIHMISQDISPLLVEIERGRFLISNDEILKKMVGLAEEGKIPLGKKIVLSPKTGGLVEVDVTVNAEVPLLQNGTAIMEVEDPSYMVTISSITDRNGRINGTEVGILLRGSNLTVSNVNVGDVGEGFHKYYKYVIESDDVSIKMGDMVVYPKELSIISGRMVAGESGMTSNGTALVVSDPYVYIIGKALVDGRNVTLPLIADGGVYAYLSIAKAGNPYFTYLNRSSLYPVLLNGVDEIINCGLPDPMSCAGYVAAPKAVPETAKMVLTLQVVDGSGRTIEHNVEIRFEINGEVQGIHGLVPKVIHDPFGLADTYLVIYPPIAKGPEGIDLTSYHELLVYYLNAVFKQLPPDKRLALTAVLAGGYTQDTMRGLSATERQFQMEKAIIDLYLLAENFDPSNSAINSDGLTVRVKLVPMVSLVWLGPIIMALSVIYIMLTTGISKARKREEG